MFSHYPKECQFRLVSPERIGLFELERVDVGCAHSCLLSVGKSAVCWSLAGVKWLSWDGSSSSMWSLNLHQAYSTWQLSRISRAARGECSGAFPIFLYITFATVPLPRASYMTKPIVSVIKTTKIHIIGRHEQISTIPIINPPEILSFLGLGFFMKITILLRSP